MNDDLLERATKALREQGGAEPPSDRAAFMRARVLSQAKRSSKLRPQSIWQWAAVVSLGFFVSTAMAQVIAVQLPRVIEALRRDNTEQAKPKQAPSKRAAKPSQPKAAPAAPSGNVEPEAPAPAQPEAEVPAAPSVNPAPRDLASHSEPIKPTAAAQPRRAQRRLSKPALSANIPSTQPAPQPTAATPEPEPTPAAAPEAPQPKAAAPESAELALFRRAQALHTAHDPRAIAAWDAFLRVAGSSVLAPEARYNRALGLVRASRFEEARRALKPFAAGAYGSYRRQEAQDLLARLPE